MKRFSQQLAAVIIFLLPLYYVRFSIGPVPTNFIEILVLILLALTLASEKRLSIPHWQPITLVLIGLFVGVSVAHDQQVAIGITKGWFVVPLAFYACLATLFGPEERPRLIKPALASAVLVSTYAILQWLGLIPLLAHQGAAAEQYLSQGRAIAFFESPNFLAMYLVPQILVVGGFLYQSKQSRLLYWLILPLVAVGLTQSLGGAVALGAGAVWLWLATTNRSRYWPYLVLLGWAIGAWLIYLPENASRLMIWKNSWYLVTTDGLLGLGAGQFQAHYALIGDGTAMFASTLPYALHPHNIFLNFWLSAGILGLGGFIWLLTLLFRRASTAPIGLAALAGLVAVLIHGLVDSTYFKNDLAIIFWLLVFLAGNSYGKQNAE